MKTNYEERNNIMKINYELISPNGNITALVPVKKSSKLIFKDYKTVAQKIISQNQKIEQVGFVQKSKQSYQFQMAGGEFSGNGLRTAAYYFFNNSEEKKLKNQSTKHWKSGCFSR